jgi:hypothetical protein
LLIVSFLIWLANKGRELGFAKQQFSIMSFGSTQRQSMSSKFPDNETTLRSTGDFSNDLKTQNERLEVRRVNSDKMLPPRPIQPRRIVAREKMAHAVQTLKKFGKFIGPGFMVAVAYIDPGNYATDVAAGADSRFSLLFMVLLSNLIAIFFQTLCIKMGSVTGGSLGDNCREHLPKWMYIGLYVLSEIAIIATDVAEVSLCLSRCGIGL